MNEVLQKELDKNYSKVQKKELKVKEGSEKLLSSYNGKIKDLESILKTEFKEHKITDKKIKDDHKIALTELKDTYKEKTALVSSNVKDTHKKYSDEVSKSDAKHEKEITRLTGLIEKERNAYAKETEKLQAKYDKDVVGNEKDKEKLEANTQKEISALQEKYNEKKEKYDQKVLALNEKRDAKITKFNEASAKKIEKLLKDVDTQRGKIDKQLADLVPVFQEKMAEVDGLLAEEKDDFDTKVGNVRSTLDSKVTRRNKFLEKAENENDPKAAKQQRKEIKQLELNADREIKVLTKAYDDRKTDILTKKLELNKNNLEQIAAVEREFVNYKEGNLMQVEQNKAQLADDITNSKLDTELKLLDELSKFNDFEAKHNDAVAEVVLRSELELQALETAVVELLIDFDKTNEINAQKLEEEISLKEKEIKIADITKDSESVLSEIHRDIELAKLDAQQQILDFAFEQDQVISDQETNIKYHKNDFEKQASVKNELLKGQQATSVLYQERAQEVLEYEELEVQSRADLKVKFLEEQRKNIEKDHANLKAVIESAYKQEKDLYDIEISKIAKEDQKALTEFKDAKEEDIQNLVEEKKELDPVKGKKRIKELTLVIEEKREALLVDIKQKEDVIRVKTGIYQDNLELAANRRDLALTQAQELFDAESNELSKAIELVNLNKESEVQAARARHAITVQNTNNFVNLSTGRNVQTTEENTLYLNQRVEKENKIIEAEKAKFESSKNTVNSNLDLQLASLDSANSSLVERIKAEALTEEAKLEGKLNEINSSIAEAEAKANKRLSDQRQATSEAKRASEAKNADAEEKTLQTLKQQEANYESSVAQIDKKADLEKKNYELEQGRVQKEYELELKKGLGALNIKLEQDVKAL